MYRLNNRSIILASSSFARKTLLENAKIDFLVKPSRIDEEPIKISAMVEKTAVQDIAILLAEIKGAQISQQFPDDFIISSDQLLEFNGHFFSKPESLEQAKTQLTALQGSTHTLHTSVMVFLDSQRIWHHLSSPKITLRPLTNIEIDEYIKDVGDSVLKTPGCYQIENQGCHIISKYTGSFFDILGLPVLPLLEFLRLHGLRVQNEK